MCLTCSTTEKGHRQGSRLKAWTSRATEKDWQKRPSDHQLQEAWKKTLIGPELPGWRQSLHTWCRQGPRKPSSCATFTLNCYWGRAATGKKSLASIHVGLLWSSPTLCNPIDCGLPGSSVRGVLQARILERIGQHWLPYPSRALYFLLP